MKTFNDFLIVAHRGYSGKYPENTMLAFEHALREGADALEFDVQLTMDGHPVVIHDEFLDRLAGVEGFVFEKNLEDLQELDVGLWRGPQFEGVGIPSLEEVCAEFGKRALLLVELKTKNYPYPGLVRKSLEIITKYGLQDRVLILSFNKDTVARVKELAPRIHAGLNCKDIDFVKEFGPYAPAEVISAARQLVNEDFLELVKGWGKKVITWTVDHEEEMERMLKHDIKAVITNHPPVLKKVVDMRR